MGFPSPISDRVIATTSQIEGYPFNLDMNNGNPIGIGRLGPNKFVPVTDHLLGWAQATILDGERSSSATSYLAPQYLARPNLYVLLNARVTRVLESPAGAVTTVEFIQDTNGKPSGTNSDYCSQHAV